MTEREQIEYLLGGLPPEENDRLDEEMFTEDAFHEELEATADDLIHAYLAGQLSDDDRRRFEANFLASPRRRARLEFVRNLVAAVGRVSPQGATSKAVAEPGAAAGAWWAWALAASLVVATVVAFMESRRRPPEGPERAAVTPPSAPASLPSQAPTPSPGATHRPEPDVRIVRLPRGVGSAPSEVPVSAATRVVRLEVPVETRPPSFDAVLRAGDGKEVWRAEELEPPRPGDPLVVAVPARVLVAGNYTLSVEGEALRAPGAPAPALLKYPLRVVRH